MSIPKLCPFCDNNATCRSKVPVVVITHEEAGAATLNSVEVDVPLTDLLCQKGICRSVDTAFETAIRDGASRIVFVIDRKASAKASELIASVINCRAILKFHDPEAPTNGLSEIRIVCESEQVDHVKIGLTKSHPLCLGCFENA